MFQIKRVYEDPSRSDGKRVLVDRLWPRGLHRAAAALDTWMMDIAPSTTLRRWFGHDPARWTEFRRRYVQELRDKQADLAELLRLGRDHTVTLLFGAKDVEHNQAVVLRDVLEKQRAPGKRRAGSSATRRKPARAITRRAPAKALRGRSLKRKASA